MLDSRIPEAASTKRLGASNFLGVKPPKTLAQRLHEPKKHADTDEAFRQTRVHPQPAGGSKLCQSASDSRTTRPLLCDRVILTFIVKDVADAADLARVVLPAFTSAERKIPLGLAPQCEPGLELVELPRVRRTRRGERAQLPQTTLLSHRGVK